MGWRILNGGIVEGLWMIFPEELWKDYEWCFGLNGMMYIGNVDCDGNRLIRGGVWCDYIFGSRYFWWWVFNISINDVNIVPILHSLMVFWSVIVVMNLDLLDVTRVNKYEQRYQDALIELTFQFWRSCRVWSDKGTPRRCCGNIVDVKVFEKLRYVLYLNGRIWKRNSASVWRCFERGGNDFVGVVFD